MTLRSRLADEPLLRARLLWVLAAAGVPLAAFGLGLVGARQPALVMIGTAVLVLGLLSIVRPDTATFVVVAILYSNAAAVAVKEHGLPYFFGIAFPLLLIVPLGYHLIVRRRHIVVTSGFPLVVGYLLVQLVGAALARDVPTAWDQVVVFLISGIGLYFVITNVIRDLTVLRRIVRLLLIVGALLGALSVFQALTGTYDNTYLGFAQVNYPGTTGPPLPGEARDIPPRLTGPIGEQNRYAQVLLVLIPIAALHLWIERSLVLRLAAVGAAVLMVLGMATTFSRGAALGLTAIIGLMFLMRYMKPVHLAIVVVAIATVLTVFPRYGERLLNLQALTRLDASTGGAPIQGDVGNLRGRATETLAALLAFADHPIVGVGPGLFPSYYQEYAREISAPALDTRIDIGTRQAHDLYAGVAAETGALGLMSFLGMVLLTLRDLFRARRRWLTERPEVAHLATGFTLAIVGYLVSGLFLHLAYERFFWLLMALAGLTGHLAARVPGADRGRPTRHSAPV